MHRKRRFHVCHAKDSSEERIVFVAVSWSVRVHVKRVSDTPYSTRVSRRPVNAKLRLIALLCCRHKDAKPGVCVGAFQSDVLQYYLNTEHNHLFCHSSPFYSLPSPA